MAQDKKHYPIIIIGGGPIGLTCGIEARKADIEYLILEKGTVVNSIYNYPVNMTFFSTSERLEIGGIPFVSNNAKPTRSEALEYYRRATIAEKLHIHIFEEVSAIEKKEEVFLITTNKASYTAGYVIIATGFYDIPYFTSVLILIKDIQLIIFLFFEILFLSFLKQLIYGHSFKNGDA